MSTTYHITSLVVHANSNCIDSIRNKITALKGADVHAISDEGKLIVTLEGDTQQAILDNVSMINTLDGVINTSLVYHQVDEEVA